MNTTTRALLILQLSDALTAQTKAEDSEQAAAAIVENIERTEWADRWQFLLRLLEEKGRWFPQLLMAGESVVLRDARTQYAAARQATDAAVARCAQLRDLGRPNALANARAELLGVLLRRLQQSHVTGQDS